jgi:carotenoid 1,2-hydratase
VHHERLRFDGPVSHDGYEWWYIDALSDDGAYGLTVIAFLGSVFSPYYAGARRRAAADPLNHCALNVALYGRRARRWAMTERGAAQVRREPARLVIGPSHVHWDGEALEIHIHERCAPLPRRLRGKIRLHPGAWPAQSFALDDAGLHRWTPYAPCARVELAFTEPDLRWSGAAYFDSNRGEEPLENTFTDWTWSRASAADNTVVLYDVGARSGSRSSLALQFTARGEVRPMAPPPLMRLPPTGWGVQRQTRADAGSRAQVLRTLVDAPFYSRSLLETRVGGVSRPAIHESLSLDRFRSRWVQCLLPFRMPRIAF